jgi:hypothetical protein
VRGGESTLIEPEKVKPTVGRDAPQGYKEMTLSEVKS